MNSIKAFAKFAAAVTGLLIGSTLIAHAGLTEKEKPEKMRALNL